MALVQLAILGIIIVSIIAFAVFLIWGLKAATRLLINSLIGFFALWVTKVFVLPGLVINFWSVIITAIFGIVGFLAVLALHLLGLFF